MGRASKGHKAKLSWKKYKSADKLVGDFHDLQNKNNKNFDVTNQVREFFDISNSNIPLGQCSQNKSKIAYEPASSTIITYCNWLAASVNT